MRNFVFLRKNVFLFVSSSVLMNSYINQYFTSFFRNDSYNLPLPPPYLSYLRRAFESHSLPLNIKDKPKTGLVEGFTTSAIVH
jgi:hypothetical protein